MNRLGRKPLVVSVFLLGLALGPAVAAQPFRLTQVFEIGGGGCTGETRLFDDSTIAAHRSPPASTPNAAMRSAAWQALDNLLNEKPRYFMTTVGCGADRVAISIDGKAYLLEAYRIEQIGAPATYYSDTSPSPRVRIEKLAVLHSIYFKQTECTQRFLRVRVHVEFNGATSEVPATAINSCP